MTTPDNQATAEKLLGQIEIAVGQLPERDGPNAPIIRSILESVNGLRSILGVVRPH